MQASVSPTLPTPPATRARIASELVAHPEAGLLGFSQGAAVVAALAAASSRGLFPPLRFVILVAGFTPRAHDIAPLFAHPVRVPSLHVFERSGRYDSRGSLASWSPSECQRPGAGALVCATWLGHELRAIFAG